MAGLEDAALPWVSVVLGEVTALLGLVGLGLAIGGASADTIGVVSGVVTGFVVLASVLRGVLPGRAAPAPAPPAART